MYFRSPPCPLAPSGGSLKGRIDEIARVIGGAEITETTRRSAEEMLRSAGV